MGADSTPERIDEQIAEIQEKLSATNVTPDMLTEPPKPVAAPKPIPTPTQTVTAPTTSPSEPGHLISDLIRSKMREKGISQVPTFTPTLTPPTTPKPEPDRTVITAEEFLAPLYDERETPPPAPEPTESKAPEKKIDEWASIRGMRDSDKIIAELEAVGIMSLSEFGGFMHNIHSPEDHTDEVAELKEQYTAIDKLLAMIKQCSDNSATYKEYQERSAYTQKQFRKKNAGAIDAYEEADKYIKEHIKDYYIDGKAPKRSELAALSKQLKDKCKAIMPEHKAYLLKHETAMRYTRQVRQYLNEQYMKREREKSRQRTQAKHRNKNTLE